MKRWISMLLAVALVLGCTACGGGGEQARPQAYTVTEGTQAYRAEPVEVLEPLKARSYALDREEIQTSNVLLSLAQSPDGTLYALEGRPDGSYWVCPVDMESGGLQAGLSFPEEITALHDGDDTYALYASTATEAYGLNPETAAATRLFNTTDLGLTGIVEMVPVEGAFLVYTDVMSASQVMVDTGTPVEKTVLTLGTVYETAELVGLVAEFNATHTDYRIEMEVYGYEGLPRLLTELAAGDLPDILNVGSYDLPTEQLIAKGYLENLYPYLDADPELSRESLLPNVLEAFEHDGALYEALSNFRVSTFISGPEEIGNDFNEIIRGFVAQIEAGEEPPLLLADGRGGFPYYIGLHLFDQFVDWETGTCCFDGEDFVNLLRYAEAVEYMDSPDDYSEDMILDGSALLFMTYAGTVRRISLYRAAWGEDYRLHGLPGLDGTSNNYIIRGDTILAISSTSEHKEMCWELIREMYIAENQIDPYDSFARAMNSPTNAEAFDAVMEYERNKEDDGTMTSDAVWTTSYEFPVKPLEEDIQIFIDLMTSVNKTTHPDYTIMDIVREESNRMFAGEQSVEETAANIQSRASIYVAEQS